MHNTNTEIADMYFTVWQIAMLVKHLLRY